MNIYVVNKEVDCEGEETLGVHSTSSGGWERVRVAILQDWDETYLDRLPEDASKPGSIEVGVVTFHVREMEVMP